MVRYVDTMNGYEVQRRGLRGLGIEPISAGLVASALLPAAGKGLEVGVNAAGAVFQNWLPAVTGATGASIFAKGVEDLSAADQAASNARLVRYAVGVGGAVLVGLIIYKAVKS